ncbi:phosphonate metabolism protein/1,5-bisphosphokinase (PRPP-forming) PhnN [Hyphomonas atlantica corrig.]|uniref:phosphonate metabolism protein/1,5-bisphosphokinase (PRPP-forming) PhnN n=1 Tax=Hyphomonas atlantica TaxID=1280948 RepID=UPI0023542C47|nr:phosphonate metabolism protein/1,5-bisphosphokinase (PRPP-forming) PhnN [Hyphomonas atlantica]
MTGVLIFVVGPSGVGKDTLLHGARDVLEGDSRFHFLRRDITRPASAGGEDHAPVSAEEFATRLDQGAYGLHWGAHDLRYGLPQKELRVLAQGKSVIANGSRSVLDQAREQFDRVAIISVTANEDLLRQRLLTRGREAQRDIENRIARTTAFEVSGDDVFTISNDGSIENGVAHLVELLAKLDGRLFCARGHQDVAHPRPGTYLISRRGREVLFALNKWYYLPGGGIEPGEMPIEALEREVLEETGHQLLTPPVHICDASRYATDIHGKLWHKLHRFYVADVERVSAPVEADHEAVWADPAVIWDQLSPEIQYALKQADRRV